MKKKKILTLTIAFIATLTVLTTALFIETNHAIANGICNNITDCNGFYYDLNGVRYNADGMKQIADDISKNGNKSEWYETILNNSGGGKVLIDNKQYAVSMPYGLNTDDKASDPSKKTALTFEIYSYSNNPELFAIDTTKTALSTWRDSELRKKVNIEVFNKLPVDLQKNIIPTVGMRNTIYQSANCNMVGVYCNPLESDINNTATIDKIHISTYSYQQGKYLGGYYIFNM
ncbi:hypothetical protein [Bifidobacterium scaligerum]|uniref:Uncharacterized protein n=1 Tax=Bifidobacterium scaligerum TaxID=2052656 RepID=A0A2M9HTA2_9BIFI|nr:hypothetical protein [Bifidobacterium scaligerum]PJM80046.1 hypothetical protein CUU80_02660 [Bifidobacterium scaligerum]